MAAPDFKLLRSEFIARLQEALKLDALCALAWFNLGTCLNEQGKCDDACIAFLFAALIQRGDAVSWANAFALAMSVKDYQFLAGHIVVAARSSCGEIFTEQLFRLADSQPGDFPRLEFLTGINDALSRIPENGSAFQVRFLLENGNVKVCTLNSGGFTKQMNA